MKCCRPTVFTENVGCLKHLIYLHKLRQVFKALSFSLDTGPESLAPSVCRLANNAGPILSVFPALIVHSELKSVHPGFPVAFIF